MPFVGGVGAVDVLGGHADIAQELFQRMPLESGRAAAVSMGETDDLQGGVGDVDAGGADGGFAGGG